MDQLTVGAWSREDQAGATVRRKRHADTTSGARNLGTVHIWCSTQLVLRAQRLAEVTGNPVGIRDCPAAVNGNDSRPSRARRRAAGTALGLISLGSDGR